MKRLRRITINAATLLSLLLCFGAALLWMKGRQRPDDGQPLYILQWFSPVRWLEAGSDQRTVYWLRIREVSSDDLGAASGPQDALPYSRFIFAQDLGSTSSGLWGTSFRFILRRSPQLSAGAPEGRLGDWENRRTDLNLREPDPPRLLPIRYQLLAVRHWVLVTLLALLPAARLLRYAAQRARVRRGQRRARAGLCSNCGYNLCATPDRCPECGCISAGAAPLPAASAPDSAAAPAQPPHLP